MANDRFFAVFGEHRSALAMDVESISNKTSKLTVAFAFCNKRDPFSRQTAKKILNGRLDKRISNPDKTVRMTFNTFYDGTHPKRDVMTPLMDVIRIAKNRDHNRIATTVSVIKVGLLDRAMALRTTANKGPIIELEVKNTV